VFAALAVGAALLVGGVVLLVVTLAGPKDVKASSVESFVRSSLPASPRSVKCPSDVEKKDGKSLDCKVTYPDGSTLTVTVHQVNHGHLEFGAADIRRG
jgi:hypothetical protein